MNYGKVGRRRRVLFQRGRLRGGGCPGAAGLRLPGVPFPGWGGKVFPLPPPAVGAGRGCWRSKCGANPSQFGVVCFLAEHIGACRVKGAILARGRMWDGRLSYWLGDI